MAMGAPSATVVPAQNTSDALEHKGRTVLRKRKWWRLTFISSCNKQPELDDEREWDDERENRLTCALPFACLKSKGKQIG